jgi:hypothetical protein
VDQIDRTFPDAAAGTATGQHLVAVRATGINRLTYRHFAVTGTDRFIR